MKLSSRWYIIIITRVIINAIYREADKRVGASDARRRVDATILKSDDCDRGR